MDTNNNKTKRKESLKLNIDFKNSIGSLGRITVVAVFRLQHGQAAEAMTTS